jgi:hypothetical protein
VYFIHFKTLSPPCNAVSCSACPTESKQPSLPTSSSDLTGSGERRLGLRRILTDDELDEFFRITAEVRAFEYGQADMEQLAPLFAPIYHGHRHISGRVGAGGFIDVGANVGDLSAMVINAWTSHSKIFYHNSLSDKEAGEKLIDKTNEPTNLKTTRWHLHIY